jgi:hypothetical protein
MIDVVLLVLKITIVALLYLFVWMVVRSAVRSVTSAAAPAPDVPLPVGAREIAVATPAERAIRREERASERTIAGEKLDFTPHIDPRLVVEESPIVPTGVIFPLEGWVMVGRASTSDIVLDEEFVSGTHARLVPRGQMYYVEDLGSTNGTYVNERQVTEAPLRPDTRLRIGETVFRYEE